MLFIGIAIYYFYSADQAKIRGFTFGNEIQELQQEIHDEQSRFISSIAKWEENTISNEEMVQIGEEHIEKFNKLLTKYDDLQPPDLFARSVKLFKLSAETQLDSERYTIEWIKTGDDAAYIRSDSLWQQSLQYEQAALLEFNLVQRQTNP